jgi:hypothetical protein
MQQRRVRLGDILDDYCPRERRITNHVVVAMIEDTVKQTRCSTCDADHEYKHAKVPSARRRKTALTSHDVETGGRLPALDEEELPADEMSDTEETLEPVEATEEMTAAPAGETADEPTEEQADEPEDERSDSDEWPVHRPLIRATLPRPEGQTPERKPTDFTVRPAGGGRFDSNRGSNGQRPGGHRPMRQAQGQSPGQGPRFGGPRPQGQGQRHGSGQGGPQGPRGNRPGQGGGRPAQGQGQGRGPRPAGGGGRKRGR